MAYDPIKAHEYYMKYRKKGLLKGRKRKPKQATSAKTRKLSADLNTSSLRSEKLKPSGTSKPKAQIDLASRINTARKKSALKSAASAKATSKKSGKTAEEKAAKEQEKAAKAEQKAQEKAAKEQEKAAKAEQKASEKAAKEEERARKAEQTAANKAAKEQEKAQKAEQKEKEKAQKAEQKAAEKAEKERQKAEQKAQKEAAKQQAKSLVSQIEQKIQGMSAAEKKEFKSKLQAAIDSIRGGGGPTTSSSTTSSNSSSPATRTSKHASYDENDPDFSDEAQERAKTVGNTDFRVLEKDDGTIALFDQYGEDKFTLPADTDMKQLEKDLGEFNTQMQDLYKKYNGDDEALKALNQGLYLELEQRAINGEKGVNFEAELKKKLGRK